MGRSFHWLLIMAMAISGLAFGKNGPTQQVEKERVAQAKADPLIAIWDEWDNFLNKYIDSRSGRVAYEKINPAMLKEHLGRYSSLTPAGWSDNRRKAAYINFYNAGMIYNILKHATAAKIDVASKKFLKLEIDDIDVPGGNLWNGDYKFNFAGTQLTLDNIEHDLIRGQATGKMAELKVRQLDPRIHAAVNCAASSCPRIREKAYRESTVNTMLDENIKAWLANSEQFKKLSDETLRANQIVYWYYEDFDSYGKQVGTKRGAGDYLATFIDPTKNNGKWMAQHLRAHFNDRNKFALKLSSNFEFFYNWQINDQRNQ